MLTVGLCGGSGSGKTLAQEAFLSAGIPCLDTDALYHAMLSSDSSLSRSLLRHFGAEVGDGTGGINRRTLASLVFEAGEAGKCRLDELNRITHGEILGECRLWLDRQRAAGAFAAVINAPLLFESGFHKECDVTVAILAPRDKRIARILSRDGITLEEAARRIDAQLDDVFLIKNTDFQIRNDGTAEALFEKVARLSDTIKKLAEEK
ncbi:MAG: dephospho-CoA kinase [Clostridia bacterium]|nr:dephospho-CoA kinase [Clostridia bacterium]